MAVLVTCKFEKHPIKNEVAIDRTKVNYGLFWLSRASNSEVNSLILPKFELIGEFMAVPVTCKFDVDPIQTESTVSAGH